MEADTGPQQIGKALAQLIALRGLNRPLGNAQLLHAWTQVAGPEIAPYTKPQVIKNGVLHIAVAHAPLLGELAGFHKPAFVARFKKDYPQFKIRDFKFKLDSDLVKPR